MADRLSNKSYFTDGTDDPSRAWMQRTVRVLSHPDWGLARVVRWYPAAGGRVASLRVMAEKNDSPQVVPISDVEIVG